MLFNAYSASLHLSIIIKSSTYLPLQALLYKKKEFHPNMHVTFTNKL